MSATVTPIQTGAPKSRARYIPDLFSGHLDELEFLWGQRRAALHSPDYFLRDFLYINERLEAHIQGLLAVPAPLADLLLPQLLAAESRDSVFAAACPLLRLAKPELIRQVFSCFSQAEAHLLPGFRDAFCFAPVAMYAQELRRILQQSEPLQAAYAATALANMRLLDPASETLAELLLCDNPVAATAAWHASIVADSQTPSVQQSRPYQQALARPEPSVREAVLKSALWTGQVWLPPFLHQLASTGDSVALTWLAITGSGAHGNLIVEQLAALPSPQQCCEILVRFAHPGVLEILRGWVASGDLVLAAEAGEAFTRITGFDVRGERIQAPISDSANEFERDFAPLIWTADLDKIDDYLLPNRDRLKAASRWSRGMSLDGVVSPETLAALDLQIRWDQMVRNRLAGDSSAQVAPIV